MNSFLNQLPEPDELLRKHKQNKDVPEVNGHLHSPFSFCAFESVNQMFEMATDEEIVALGINDFYTTDGYADFEQSALESGIFPLFNIEFMGLMKDLQEKEVRVNDPNNPGRVYFSGKGLKHPLKINDSNKKFLKALQDNSQLQVLEMCEKVNELLEEINSPFGISYGRVKEEYAESLVRERHIARAIREYSYEHFKNISERLDFYERLFSGRKLTASFNNPSELENEIRSVLLKKGGRAFVPENSEAFPDLEEIIAFIIDAGGIPCYPVLLDDQSGNITKFEGDWNEMDKLLNSLGVRCLELIPQRNSLEKLAEFVEFFKERNYVISFGTEHNAPELFPITVKVENGRDIPADLKKVSYQGICVLAAHQYLVARGTEGFVKQDGKSNIEHLDFYQDLGNAVIREFNSKPSRT